MKRQFSKLQFRFYFESSGSVLLFRSLSLQMANRHCWSPPDFIRTQVCSFVAVQDYGDTNLHLLEYILIPDGILTVW